MRVLILGCGTSTGVPRLAADGPDWGECDPEEPRNRRSRVSILLESDEGRRILVDTSPDLRAQMLANRIGRVDAVFWTHDHADHAHGIDDLRPLRYGRGAPIAGYAATETVRRLRHRFSYIFAGEFGYPTVVEISNLDTVRICAGFAVQSCQMPHGPAQSTAYRFDAHGISVGYATDFSEITPAMTTLFDRVDLLVTDCLRREPHPTHAHLGMALELAKAVHASRTVLTHLDKSMDYATLSRELPPDVLMAYDGMEIRL